MMDAATTTVTPGDRRSRRRSDAPPTRSAGDPVASPPTLLRIEGLEKSFGDFCALRGVTFDLAAGERLAFLGPNGAGKTTLIRCLSGRCRPDAGTIRVDGRRLRRSDDRVAFGLVPQEIAVYGDLTTRENLMAFGRLYGLSRRELRLRVDWALQWTGLSRRSDELVGTFSGGMKRRVNLACGVLHRPRILLLDEPTVGVDPQSRHKIFEMLDELSRGGTAIVLTTHHLDEAQARSDRIVIMDHGRVVADGTIEQLIARTVGPARMVRLRLDRPIENRLAMATDGPTIGAVGDDEVHWRIDDAAEGLPRLMAAIRQRGYGVRDVEVHAPTLHHVFLNLTGHELRDQ